MSNNTALDLSLTLSLSSSVASMPSAVLSSGADCAPMAFIPSLDLIDMGRWGNLPSTN